MLSQYLCHLAAPYLSLIDTAEVYGNFRSLFHTVIKGHNPLDTLDALVVATSDKGLLSCVEV